MKIQNMDYKWSAGHFSIKDVILNKDDRFEYPVFVKVVQINKECATNENIFKEDVYRLDSICNQHRFYVEGSENKYFSIPEKYELYVWELKNGVRCKGPTKLDGMRESSLPVLVEFDKKKSSLEDWRKHKFCKIKLLKRITSSYAKASLLNDEGCICQDIIPISAEWDITVSISMAPSLSLCRGCSDYLQAYMKKNEPPEPDNQILDMTAEQIQTVLTECEAAGKTYEDNFKLTNLNDLEISKGYTRLKKPKPPPKPGRGRPSVCRRPTYPDYPAPSPPSPPSPPPKKAPSAPPSKDELSRSMSLDNPIPGKDDYMNMNRAPPPRPPKMGRSTSAPVLERAPTLPPRKNKRN